MVGGLVNTPTPYDLPNGNLGLSNTWQDAIRHPRMNFEGLFDTNNWVILE